MPLLNLQPKPSPMTATPAGMTYADYLNLDTLLSAQHPISDLHDEMLFVIIHQTKELWLKQMLHEVRFACRLVEEDKFAEAYKALSRVSRIWTVMTLSWDVLATLTPVDYTAFRDVLGTSSGFQSAQFRELEFRLGIKDPKFLNFYEGGSEGHARLEKAMAEPSLWDQANAALVRAGFGHRRRGRAEGQLAGNLSSARRVFRSLSTGRKAGRSRRRARRLAAQAYADGRADHRHEEGHRRIGGRCLPRLDPVEAGLPGIMVPEDR